MEKRENIIKKINKVNSKDVKCDFMDDDSGLP